MRKINVFFLLISFFILGIDMPLYGATPIIPQNSGYKQTPSLKIKKDTEIYHTITDNRTTQINSNIDSTIPNDKTDKQEKYNDSQVVSERIMEATIALAIFAFIQSIAMVLQYFSMQKQVRELRKSVKATKEAANAAQKSAEVLPAVERAYVFVNMNGKARVSRVESAGEEPERIFDVPINLINEGKTPAVLIKVCAGIIITRDNPTIAKTEHIIEEKPFNLMRGDSDKRVIRGGGEWHITTDITGISDSDFLEVLNPERKNDPPRLYCCGKVVYRDVMKDCHTTWFCWEYGAYSGFFSLADNDEMNDYT